MSLCDTCKAPGHCCRSLTLYGNDLDSPDMSDDEAIAILEWFAEYEKETFGWEVPFIPYGRDSVGAIKFMCPKLGDDGRCTIYETRPSTCRDFEPASGPLCVHYKDGT